MYEINDVFAFDDLRHKKILRAASRRHYGLVSHRGDRLAFAAPQVFMVEGDQAAPVWNMFAQVGPRRKIIIASQKRAKTLVPPSMPVLDITCGAAWNPLDARRVGRTWEQAERILHMVAVALLDPFEPARGYRRFTDEKGLFMLVAWVLTSRSKPHGTTLPEVGAACRRCGEAESVQAALRELCDGTSFSPHRDSGLRDRAFAKSDASLRRLLKKITDKIESVCGGVVTSEAEASRDPLYDVTCGHGGDGLAFIVPDYRKKFARLAFLALSLVGDDIITRKPRPDLTVMLPEVGRIPPVEEIAWALAAAQALNTGFVLSDPAAGPGKTRWDAGQMHAIASAMAVHVQALPLSARDAARLSGTASLVAGGPVDSRPYLELMGDLDPPRALFFPAFSGDGTGNAFVAEIDSEPLRQRA